MLRQSEINNIFYQIIAQKLQYKVENYI